MCFINQKVSSIYSISFFTCHFFAYGSPIIKSRETFSKPTSRIICRALIISPLSPLHISLRVRSSSDWTHILSLFTPISLSCFIYDSPILFGVDSREISIFS